MREEERLRARYQGAIARRGAADGEPVPLERLEALASSRLTGEEALALLDRVMSDPELRREFELLQAIHLAAMPPARRTLPRWIGLAAAAVLVVALPFGWRALGDRGAPEGPPLVRGGAVGVALLAPAERATVDAPVTLVWGALPDAVRYRVEVLDATGAVAVDAETPDTSLVLDRTALAPSRPFRWSVEAVTPGGLRRSPTQSFTTGSP